MRIPQAFTEAVRNQADIVRVVSDYVSLKKAGKNYEVLVRFLDRRNDRTNGQADARSDRPLRPDPPALSPVLLWSSQGERAHSDAGHGLPRNLGHIRKALGGGRAPDAGFRLEPCRL